MARPTDRGDAKTAVLNIRVTPALKAKLATYSKMGGKKLSAECEGRLQRSIEETEAPRSSEQTRNLLDEIERLIEAIEIGTKNKWHKGVGTWAAVAEMLATGPIMARAPSHIGENDAKLAALYKVIVENTEKREEIASELTLLELPPSIQSGIFWPSADAERINLRDTVAAMKLPKGIGQRAVVKIDELEAVDESDRQARAMIDAIIEPFRQAIEDGRRLYTKPQKGETLAATLGRLDMERRHFPMAPLLNADKIMEALSGRPKWPATLGGLFSQPSGQRTTIGQLFNGGGKTKRNDDGGPTTDDTP